jgi:hypothetical protein
LHKTQPLPTRAETETEKKKKDDTRAELSMKRFFKPIEKEGSAKKPSLSSDCPSAVKTEGDASAKSGNENEVKKDPLKFLTWNANSLLLRIKNDWPQFSSFVQTLDPDIICIQVLSL